MRRMENSYISLPKFFQRVFPNFALCCLLAMRQHTVMESLIIFVKRFFYLMENPRIASWIFPKFHFTQKREECATPKSKRNYCKNFGSILKLYLSWLNQLHFQAGNNIKRVAVVPDWVMSDTSGTNSSKSGWINCPAIPSDYCMGALLSANIASRGMECGKAHQCAQSQTLFLEQREGLGRFTISMRKNAYEIISQTGFSFDTPDIIWSGSGIDVF